MLRVLYVMFPADERPWILDEGEGGMSDSINSTEFRKIMKHSEIDH